MCLKWRIDPLKYRDRADPYDTHRLKMMARAIFI
jgi:hypothetical protein